MKIALEREKQKELSRPDHCLSDPKAYQNGASGIVEDIEDNTMSPRHNITECVSLASGGENSNSSFIKVRKCTYVRF